VKSLDLTTGQAAKINDRIRPLVSYLYRLKERMERRSFPRDDPYYLLVVRAHDAMHRLFVETHYMSCKQGVGRGDRK